MKIFQTFLRNFEWMGISANRVPFGLTELKHTFAYILIITLLSLQLAKEAETNSAKMKSMAMTVAMISLLIAYLSFRFHSQTVFKIINELEQVINQSE